MTLDQLRALHAVVVHSGFRPAAETLFKSQSAISIAIRKLEEELGIALFTRDKYRPSLTAAGRAIHDKAVSLLTGADELSDLAHHFSEGVEPELRVAMSALVPVNAALGVFSHIKNSAPATRLVLLIETLNGTLERLEDGDADIAICETFDHQDHYISTPLTGIEMISVISPGHRLAVRAEELTEKDMAGSTQIIVRDTSRHSEKRTAGVVKGTHHWVVSDFITKKQIIASGIGWGRMPLHLVQDEISHGELLILTHEDFHPLKVEIKAVRKKDKALGPVATQLWQQLQDIDWL